MVEPTSVALGHVVWKQASSGAKPVIFWLVNSMRIAPNYKTGYNTRWEATDLLATYEHILTDEQYKIATAFSDDLDGREAAIGEAAEQGFWKYFTTTSVMEKYRTWQDAKQYKITARRYKKYMITTSEKQRREAAKSARQSKRPSANPPPTPPTGPSGRANDGTPDGFILAMSKADYERPGFADQALELAYQNPPNFNMNEAGISSSSQTAVATQATEQSPEEVNNGARSLDVAHEGGTAPGAQHTTLHPLAHLEFSIGVTLRTSAMSGQNALQRPQARQEHGSNVSD